MAYIKMVNDIISNNPNLASRIQSLPDKIRVARKSNDTNAIITFIKQGWIKKFVKYENGTSNEIEFEEAAQLLEANVEEKGLEIPNDYFEGFNSNKNLYSTLVDSSKATNLSNTASPNEKKVRNTLRALLTKSSLKTTDREYLEKVENAIKRGSLNSRVLKDVKNAIDKNSQSFDGIVNAFKTVIDEVFLVERTNYDVQDSLNKPKVIVLSEYLEKDEK